MVHLRLVGIWSRSCAVITLLQSPRWDLGLSGIFFTKSAVLGRKYLVSCCPALLDAGLGSSKLGTMSSALSPDSDTLSLVVEDMEFHNPAPV
jgi:hypothetical protein